jgi:hypothetical protein
MTPSFAELRFEPERRVVVTDVSIAGHTYRLTFARLPDGSVSDAMITGVGEESRAVVQEAVLAARDFKRDNGPAIDALLPKI